MTATDNGFATMVDTVIKNGSLKDGRIWIIRAKDNAAEAVNHIADLVRVGLVDHTEVGPGGGGIAESAVRVSNTIRNGMYPAVIILPNWDSVTTNGRVKNALDNLLRFCKAKNGANHYAIKVSTAGLIALMDSNDFLNHVVPNFDANNKPTLSAANIALRDSVIGPKNATTPGPNPPIPPATVLFHPDLAYMEYIFLNASNGTTIMCMDESVSFFQNEARYTDMVISALRHNKAFLNDKGFKGEAIDFSKCHNHVLLYNDEKKVPKNLADQVPPSCVFITTKGAASLTTMLLRILRSQREEKSFQSSNDTTNPTEPSRQASKSAIHKLGDQDLSCKVDEYYSFTDIHADLLSGPTVNTDPSLNVMPAPYKNLPCSPILMEFLEASVKFLQPFFHYTTSLCAFFYDRTAQSNSKTIPEDQLPDELKPNTGAHGRVATLEKFKLLIIHLYAVNYGLRMFLHRKVKTHLPAGSYDWDTQLIEWLAWVRQGPQNLSNSKPEQYDPKPIAVNNNSTNSSGHGHGGRSSSVQKRPRDSTQDHQSTPNNGGRGGGGRGGGGRGGSAPRQQPLVSWDSWLFTRAECLQCKQRPKPHHHTLPNCKSSMDQAAWDKNCTESKDALEKLAATKNLTSQSYGDAQSADSIMGFPGP